MKKKKVFRQDPQGITLPREGVNISRQTGKENHRLKKWILMGYVIVPWRVYIFTLPWDSNHH